MQSFFKFVIVIVKNFKFVTVNADFFKVCNC